MERPFTIFVPVAITALASLSVTGFVRAYAMRNAVLDVPNERSSHTTPTPRGGGVGVLVGSMLGISIAWVLGTTDIRIAGCLALGMSVLGVVGWLDDRRGLSSNIRLIIHVMIAAATAYWLGGMPELRVGGRTLALGWTGGIIATIGVVWSINLFNFMDGLDGFAGSQAVLIFATAAGLFFYLGDMTLGILAAIFAAASVGFLFWNWPPARIFLGDVGSGPLGYLIASLAIASESRMSTPLLVFGVLGGVLVFDATVTLCRRVLRGRRLSEAHRDHAYQRLMRLWGDHRSVTLAAIGVTALLSVLAIVGTMNPALVPRVLIASTLLLGGLMLAAERGAPM